jgi:hypothetical protein
LSRIKPSRARLDRGIMAWFRSGQNASNNSPGT